MHKCLLSDVNLDTTCNNVVLLLSTSRLGSIYLNAIHLTKVYTLLFVYVRGDLKAGRRHGRLIVTSFFITCVFPAVVAAPDCHVFFHGMLGAVVAGQLYLVCQLHLLMAGTHAHAGKPTFL